MSLRHDLDGAVHAFLEDGQTELPDRAFNAVRHDIHRTRQRAVIGPWRIPDMSTIARGVVATAAAVAAIAVVAVAWVDLGSSTGGVGAAPAPIPTGTPVVSPSLPVLRTGELEPGRYQFGNSLLSAAVPAGWSGFDDEKITKDYAEAAGAGFGVWEISGTFVDPCTDHTLVTPSPTTIDELAAALANQPGTSATAPADVTIDGYSGKVVEVTVTREIESCGPDGFWLWASPNNDRRYVQDTRELNRIYILDIEGFRYTFFARIPERTTEADRAELEAIIESIDIQIR